jgi:hypothetical protein
VVFIVSLPQYVVMEEDHLGKVRLMEVLNMLYNIPIDKEEFEKRCASERSSRRGSRLLRRWRTSLPAREHLRHAGEGDGEGGHPPAGSDMEEIFWKHHGEEHRESLTPSEGCQERIRIAPPRPSSTKRHFP